MFNMIINGFDTGSIPNCYVTDFGEDQTATPRVESNTIYGANGDYNLYDGAYDGYDKTVSLYVVKTSEIEMIVNQFKPEENKIEFSHRPGSIFYADFQSASLNRTVCMLGL